MPLCLLSLLLVVSLLLSDVIRHVLAALLKIARPGYGIRKDYTFQPAVSILLPCYNEGETVYDTVSSICQSNYPHGRFEIIAVDDCSVDDSYEWLQRAQRDFPEVRIALSRNGRNCGKARTVCNALRQSSAEIILSIDSDCIFHPDAIRELAACFADPKIGAVGGAVGVRNVNESLATRIQTFVYYTNFRLIKGLENWTKTVICISGCMFAIRRDLFVKLEPRVRNRKWFGIEVNDGEDRFLTHQVLLEGYGTIINTAAQCWTTVPNTLPKLFKQQIRWQRSGVRDFLLTVRTLPRHVGTLHPVAFYNLLLPTLTAMCFVLVMFVIPWNNIPFWVAPYLLLLYAAGACVFNRIVCKHNPEQAVLSPWRLAAFAVWLVAGRLIEIIALFTLDSQDWGTRAKTMSEEEIGQSEQRGAVPADSLAHAILQMEQDTVTVA